jgi:hypothetical protein
MGQVLCPVLIGRESEMRTLESTLVGAVGGRGCCAVILGEPGIGKSRLVRELTGRAMATGVPVVTGRAVPSSINSPYRPLTEALLQLLRDHDLPSDAGMAPWLPALAALTPGVIAGAAGARRSGSPDGLRRRASQSPLQGPPRSAIWALTWGAAH